MKGEKAALVTGGSRGIGRAVCVALAADGYDVVINYRAQQDAALETLEQVRAAGGDGELVQFDVRDGEQVRACMAEVIERHPKLHALVNNAGVTADGLMVRMPPDDWDRVIRTSLDGFYNVTKPALDAMMRNRSGSVVTISSISGLSGNRGQANYSAAKAGLIGASRALAYEVARIGIRVNVVAPGLIETDMLAATPIANVRKLIPLARLGKPAEVAGVVRFLCSDEASYVTGAVLSVDGGFRG